MNEESASSRSDNTPQPRLCLNSNLEFSERLIGENLTYVGYDPLQNKYFHFGVVEREVYRWLQEEVALENIITRLQELGISWDEPALSEYIATLTKWGIIRVDRGEVATAMTSHLHSANTQSPAEPPQPAHQSPANSALQLASASPLLKAMGTVLCPRLPLFAAGPWAAPWIPIFGWLYARAGYLIWSLCVSSSVWIVWNERAIFSNQVTQLMSPHYWPWFAVLWFLIKILHEAGHTICALQRGVRVGNAGLMLFMGAPMFYVDVTDAWKLKRRRDRVLIALAGVYLELFIASLAVWVWYISEDRTYQYAAAQVILLAGPATLLVNANPLLRLDGYYALSDLVNIPNLRMHGRRLLGNFFEYLFLGRARQQSFLDPWRTAFSVCHAICSVLFQIFWMGGLIVGVSYFAGSIGLLLAACAVSLWVIAPTIAWGLRLKRAGDWQTVRPRLLVCSGIIVGSLLILGSFPSPFARRVPTVVRYRDADHARSAVNGFVRTVYVQEGDWVQRGDILVELDDPDLRVRRSETAFNLEIARAKIRSFSHGGNQAMAEAEREKTAAFSRQLWELDRQIDALSVKASRDGTVCSSGLSQMKDRFVKKGDVIALIADESDKELVTSIAPGDLDAYLHLAEQYGNASLRGIENVRLRGGIWIESKVEQPKPRFSDVIPHPALAATAGGPLAVSEPKPESDPLELRTTVPRSLGTSRLDSATARQVRAGQQGILFVGDTRSLWERVGDWVIRWVSSDKPI